MSHGLRRGDRQAFEQLFVLLRGDVYNLAARILGDRDEAQDITQEVFLRAYRHLPEASDQVRPEAWVFRTTVNACYDHLRRRGPAPIELDAEREAAANDAVRQAAMVAAVEGSLEGLNPRYRTVLVLKDLHGLGNAEIAEVMGVARGTVGVLLFRARGAFQRRYREIAPTLGAGLPMAGVAISLPALPLPAALMGSPAFLAPLAAPSALAPLAPAAGAATPIAAGLAKLAGALTTKTAVVAIAATAVAGGGLAAYETHHAPLLRRSVAVASPAGAHTDDLTGHDAAREHTHASLTAERMHHADEWAGRYAPVLADAAHGGTGDGTASGDGAHGGSGTQDDEAYGGDPDAGAHTGDGGTQGGSDGGGSTGGEASDGETHTGGVDAGGDAGSHDPAL
jgi:RNA polymerase sigma-70 factor (ECF subfamily)